MNKQIPIKQERTEGLFLNVHSIFYTIQGEGPYAGRPAVFVRLAGCNLQCPACDTEYTEGAKRMSVGEIILEIQNSRDAVQAVFAKQPIVVITGGEPFRQSIGRFVNTLLVLEWEVQIETNGTLFDDSLKWGHRNLRVVCSPKTGKVAKGLWPHIDAYKYVLDCSEMNKDDGLPIRALGHTAVPQLARPHEGFDGIVYLQPIDVGDGISNAIHRQVVVDSCKKFGYTLCLQIHKIIEVE